MTINLKGRTVLLIVAGVGMVTTAFLAAKNTPEAQKRKEEALAAKKEKTGDENAKLTFMESVQAQVGAYAPAIVSGMVTLGSLTGSEIINKENMKKAEKAFSDYKDMTQTIAGKSGGKVIEKAVEQKKLDEKSGKPWERKEQFRIVFQGHSIQFESTREDVVCAIYEINRKFQIDGIVTFNDFLRYLDQEPVEEGANRGWESYVGEAVYGYTWIDFGMKQNEDEPWVTEIFMAVYPHFFDEEEACAEIDEEVKKLSGGKAKDD